MSCGKSISSGQRGRTLASQGGIDEQGCSTHRVVGRDDLARGVRLLGLSGHLDCARDDDRNPVSMWRVQR
jgi:hypothetical protein